VLHSLLFLNGSIVVALDLSLLHASGAATTVVITQSARIKNFISDLGSRSYDDSQITLTSVREVLSFYSSHESYKYDFITSKTFSGLVRHIQQLQGEPLTHSFKQKV
jgi:hypothetical protein